VRIHEYHHRPELDESGKEQSDRDSLVELPEDAEYENIGS
jgi:hypothetical protein